jgi:1-acyl-sn-glycerol-3-phosphate acyltransferase
MAFKLRFINIVFVFYVFVMAVFTPIMFVPALIIYLTAGLRASNRYIHRAGALYARHLFFVFGVKVKLKGIENLPETNNICFVSNHQGLADIPLIVGFIPKKVGFIAKKELGRIPFLNIWMKALGCILINRKDIRQSLKVIEKGASQIDRGHPMVIFPEGTRSRGSQMGNFKAGAFKLLAGIHLTLTPLLKFML